MAGSMPIIRRTSRGKQNKGAWMVTFTDLVSLMLTFFVMLFSMSHVLIDRWEEMIDSLSTTLNPQREEVVVQTTAEYNISTVFQQRAINLEYLEAVFNDKVGDDPVLTNSVVQLLEDRLVISLPGDLLFNAGSATLSARAEVAMASIGDVLRHVSNQVVINGHSDPVPGGGQGFSTNWELSLARAIAVGNALRPSGFEEDFIAYGYGDSKFEQLPDLPQDSRYALARRVDIMVLHISSYR